MVGPNTKPSLSDMPDKDGETTPNIAAIVGGVIAALLAIAGIAAALPMLGVHVPGM